MKRIVLILSLIMAQLYAMSATINFTVDGISYRFLDADQEEYPNGVRIVGVSNDAVSSDGTVTIPATVTYQDVEYSPFYLYQFGQNSTMKKLILNCPVKMYHSSCFMGCTALEWMEIHNPYSGFYCQDGVMYRIRDKFLFYCPQQCDPDDILIPDYTAIFQAAFYNNQKTEKIVIPATCREIQAQAFQQSTIREIQIIGTEECDTIKNQTFNDCHHLVKVDLGENIRYIDDWAFAKCGMQPMSTPYHVNPSTPLDLSRIIKIKHCAFAGTKNFYFYKFGPDLEEIGHHIFCNNDIALTDMSMCTKLRIIPEFAFYNCSKLRFTNYLPEGLVEIQYEAFGESRDAFSSYCFARDGKITLPSTVETIGYYVFQNSNSQYIELDKSCWDISGLTFGVWPKLKGITLNSENTLLKLEQLGKSEDPVLFSADKKRLIWYPLYTIVNLSDPVNADATYYNLDYPPHKRVKGYRIPEGVEDLTPGAFSNFYGDKGQRFFHVTIPNSVTRIGACCFHKSGIKDLTIPATVTEIYGAGTINDNYSKSWASKVDFELNGGMYIHTDGIIPRLFDEVTNVFLPAPSPLPAYKEFDNYGPTKYFVKRTRLSTYTNSNWSHGQNSYDQNPIPLPIRSKFSSKITKTIASSGISTLCRDFDVDLSQSATTGITAYIAKSTTTDEINPDDMPLPSLYEADRDYNLIVMTPVTTDRSDKYPDGKYIPSRYELKGDWDYIGVVVTGTPGQTFTYYMGEDDCTTSNQVMPTNADINMLGDAPVETWMETADIADDGFLYCGLNSGYFKYYWRRGVLDWNHAYLKLPKYTFPGHPAESDEFAMLFMNGDEETGIKDVTATTVYGGEKDVYYNLNGVRVENPTKGVYIMNGKKVVIK